MSDSGSDAESLSDLDAFLVANFTPDIVDDDPEVLDSEEDAAQRPSLG